MINDEPKHPIPAVLSFFFPGLGQIIKGELGRGVGFFLGFLFTLPFIVPPFVIWLVSIHDAYHHNPSLWFTTETVVVQAPRPQTVSPESRAAEEEALPPRPRMAGRKFWGTVLLSGALLGLFAALSENAPWWPSFLFVGLPLSLGGLLWWTALRREGEWQQESRKAKERKREKEILRCAQRHGGRVTAPQVAMETSLSLDEAKESLDRMSDRGHVGISVSEGGALIYEFYELAEDREPTSAERLVEPFQTSEDRLWEELQEGGK
jgi:hypothetical protein